MFYKVKEVSAMTGLSVRMLHHYDSIGLLKPDHVTEAGYRQYSEDNLAKLQQIMFLKELDFSLKGIKDMMGRGEYDQVLMLEKQQILLEQKVVRLRKIIDNIEMTIESHKGGKTMSNKDRFASFDRSEIEAHKKKYAREAEERWGGSDAYAQARKKTEKYSNEDLARIKSDTEDVYRELTGLMDREVSDERVQALIAALRQGITDHFYDCTPEIFAGLGQMYVADERFKAYLDGFADGFSEYLSRAIEWYSLS